MTSGAGAPHVRAKSLLRRLMEVCGGEENGGSASSVAQEDSRLRTAIDEGFGSIKTWLVVEDRLEQLCRAKVDQLRIIMGLYDALDRYDSHGERSTVDKETGSYLDQLVGGKGSIDIGEVTEKSYGLMWGGLSDDKDSCGPLYDVVGLPKGDFTGLVGKIHDVLEKGILARLGDIRNKVITRRVGTRSNKQKLLRTTEREVRRGGGSGKRASVEDCHEREVARRVRKLRRVSSDVNSPRASRNKTVGVKETRRQTVGGGSGSSMTTDYQLVKSDGGDGFGRWQRKSKRAGSLEVYDSTDDESTDDGAYSTDDDLPLRALAHRSKRK